MIIENKSILQYAQWRETEKKKTMRVSKKMNFVDAKWRQITKSDFTTEIMKTADLDDFVTTCKISETF